MTLFLAFIGLVFVKSILTELGRMPQLESSIIHVVLGIFVLLVLDFSGLINLGDEELG